MKFARIGLFISLSLVGITASIAQEGLPFYQQYLISDKVLINPSYTGSTDDIVLKTTFFRQWADFQGAPNMQTVSTHFNVVDRLGLGAYFFRDENGPVSMQGVNLSAAYHIPLSDEETRENRFSFGPSLSLFSQNYDWSRIIPENPNDPLIGGDPSIFLPYLNLGISAHYKGFFGGVSVLDIPLSNNTPIVNQIEPTPTVYYFNVGYNWRFKEAFSIEPSVLMNLNTNSERHLDLNLIARYYFNENSIAVGVSHRTDVDENGSQNLSISPLIMAEIGKLNFSFLYSIGASDISRDAGNGFMLGLGYNLDNFINPRGFRYR